MSQAVIKDYIDELLNDSDAESVVEIETPEEMVERHLTETTE